MPAKPGFTDYVRAAFNARPWGMFVAPNWIGLGAFGLLGTVDPGFWVLGAGLELGLPARTLHQSALPAGDLVPAGVGRAVRMERPDPATHAATERRGSQPVCGTHRPLSQHHRAPGTGGVRDARTDWRRRPTVSAVSPGCSCVCSSPRGTIRTILQDGEEDEQLAQRHASLKRQVDDPAAAPELRRSIAGQMEILEQRIEQRKQAESKLAFIDAEIARIEEQVELIREQAALSTDPELLSRRIDEITATLGGTGQWIRDQQQVYGAMEDLLSEPPPLTPDARARESQ